MYKLLRFYNFFRTEFIKKKTTTYFLIKHIISSNIRNNRPNLHKIQMLQVFGLLGRPVCYEQAGNTKNTRTDLQDYPFRSEQRRPHKNQVCWL